jgi:hypothetical protein
MAGSELGAAKLPSLPAPPWIVILAHLMRSRDRATARCPSLVSAYVRQTCVGAVVLIDGVARPFVPMLWRAAAGMLGLREAYSDSIRRC